MPNLVSLAQSFLTPEDPTSKTLSACGACSIHPQERHPQWILSWYSMRVTCEFRVGVAPRLTCRCVRIFLASLDGAARATCHVLLIDPKQDHHRSGGSLSRTVPRQSRSDQQFSCYSQKSLDTQISHLKCRSQNPSNPPTTHRLQ